MGHRTHIYLDDDAWEILSEKRNKSLFINELIRNSTKETKSNVSQEQIYQIVTEILEQKNKKEENIDIMTSINNLLGGI